MKTELKVLFWEWFSDKYADRITNKDEDIEFKEKHYQEILDEFATEVGL